MWKTVERKQAGMGQFQGIPFYYKLWCSGCGHGECTMTTFTLFAGCVFRSSTSDSLREVA